MSKSGKITVKQVKEMLESEEKAREFCEYLAKKFVDMLKENPEKFWWENMFWDLFTKATFCHETITVSEVENVILLYNSSIKDLFTRDAYALIQNLLKEET